MRFRLLLLLCFGVTVAIAGNDKSIKKDSGLKSAQQDKELLVVVNDVFGETLYSKVIIMSDEEKNVIAVDPYQRIKPGVYYIVGTSNDIIYHKNLTIQ